MFVLLVPRGSKRAHVWCIDFLHTLQVAQGSDMSSSNLRFSKSRLYQTLVLELVGLVGLAVGSLRGEMGLGLGGRVRGRGRGGERGGGDLLVAD